MRNTKYILILIIAFCINGCSVYNFTGTGKIDAKTFQVNYFQNNAELIEPGIERTFTQKLQEIIQKLNLPEKGLSSSIKSYKPSTFEQITWNSRSKNFLT